MSETVAKISSEQSRDPALASWIGLVFVFAALSLLWELLQLPFYTLWNEGSAREIAYALIHCMGGDVLIGATAATASHAAIRLFRQDSGGTWLFLLFFIPLTLTYTVFSEWLNVQVLRSWAYADKMPLVPPFGTGLTPMLQWVFVPLVTWAAAGRPTRARLVGRRPDTDRKPH